MKKNMRKVAALGLCVALGATMLTACGGSKGKSASGGKTELNFGIWDENQRPAMEKMVKAYEKENSDVKINIQLTPYKGGEYWTKLEAAASGGLLRDDHIHHQWIPGIRCHLYDDRKNESGICKYADGCYVILPSGI